MGRAEETLRAATTIRQQNRDWTNVFYLSGLAVEHALWAVRCRRAFLMEADYMAVPGHSLARIAAHAGLGAALADEGRKRKGFRVNWVAITDWDSNSRYRSVSAPDAKELHLAVSNSTNGAMRWLRESYQTLP